MGDSPEGQRGSGRLEVLQERSLGAAGADCPHVLSNELSGKTTDLAERGALAGSSGKTEEFTNFGKRGRQPKKSTGI